MALTRTRTQTALTTLCTLIANVHGELEFIGWALQFRKQGLNVLVARRQMLVGQREALYTTLRFFDPKLDPAGIGVLQEWLKLFGRKATPRVVGRYVKRHLQGQPTSSPAL